MRFFLIALLIGSVAVNPLHARAYTPWSWGYEDGFTRGNHCSKGFFFSRSFCWLRTY